MPIADFRALSVWTNVAVFAGAAVVVWLAGTRLAYYADAISERTKLSKALLGLIASFVGVALVAASTAVPELSTALAAVRQGNRQMAISNILGTNCLEVVGLYFMR